MFAFRDVRQVEIEKAEAIAHEDQFYPTHRESSSFQANPSDAQQVSEAIAVIDELVRLATPAIRWLRSDCEEDRSWGAARGATVAAALTTVFQATSWLVTPDCRAQIGTLPTLEDQHVEAVARYLQRALTFLVAWRRGLARQLDFAPVQDAGHCRLERSSRPECLGGRSAGNMAQHAYGFRHFDQALRSATS